jgi:hypothetical protein
MSITFTKLFSSITESTIWCEPSETRIVWITMLAMSDKEGRIWGSIPGLANRAQVSVDAVEKALEKFLSPDNYSRTPDNEGRRIEPIDGGWRLLNHAKYRALRDSEERKEYKREWIKKKREQEKVVDNVDTSRPQYTNTEADTDTDKPLKTRTKKFSPPTQEEVLAYCQERSNKVDAERFMAHYTSNGWKVGKNPMKNWKAAVITWEKNDGAGNEKDTQSRAKRFSDKLDDIARKDIEQNGHTDFVD